MTECTIRWSVTRTGSAAAALLLILAAAGCERPPSTGSNAFAAPSATTTKPTDAATSAPTTAPTATSPTAEAAPRYVAYYFHRTLRCATCLSIEQQSHDALALFFGDTPRWRTVNIEESGNEHFERDFSLDRQALVLVELDGAQVKRSKLLPRVWELVDDAGGFQEYVVSEVADFLGGNP